MDINYHSSHAWDFRQLFVRLVVGLIAFASVASAAKAANSAGSLRPSRSHEDPSTTVNLRDFGATGDGVSDDGPALQQALDAIAEAGGGTLYVPTGEYSIVTPVSKDFSTFASSVTIQGDPSSTPIDVAGNGAGLNLTSEFIIRAGETNDAITIRGLQTLLIKDVAFLGDVEVRTDARTTITLIDVSSAIIQHCEFYGIASLVEGGAIVAAYVCSLSIKESAFLGCAGNSGVYTSIVQNIRWKGISVVDSKFVDYGNRPDFYSKTPLAPPLSWVSIGNAAVLDSSSSRREAIIQNVFMDEGAFFGISALDRYENIPSALFEVYISRVSMNVTNLAAYGVYLKNAQKVFIERSHFGWSHNASAAIWLWNVREGLLDQLECVDHADVILADVMQRLIVINSIYRELDSDAPDTRVIVTENPMDDPVQYVRQQYLDVAGHEPDLVGHYYWADLMLRCVDNSACISQQRAALATYLAAAPPAKFSVSGIVRDENGTAMPSVTVNLTGSQSISTATDSNGRYSFLNLATAGNYVVTASKQHYVFQNLILDRPTEDQVANFVGILNRHTIHGRVVNTAGAGIPLALVTLSDPESQNNITNLQGDYSFPDLPAGSDYTIAVSRPDYSFPDSSETILDLSSDQVVDFTGAPNPNLLAEEGTNRAIALHSVLFTREPFSVVSPLNPGPDKGTRIMLFATNVELLPNETLAVVSAKAVDSQGRVYPLTVEYLDKVPGFDWLSSVIVKLPDDQTLQGEISVSISVRGVSSNSVVLAITATQSSLAFLYRFNPSQFP